MKNPWSRMTREERVKKIAFLKTKKSHSTRIVWLNCWYLFNFFLCIKWKFISYPFPWKNYIKRKVKFPFFNVFVAIVCHSHYFLRYGSYQKNRENKIWVKKDFDFKRNDRFRAFYEFKFVYILSLILYCWNS